jgi:hypothetical protein
MACGTEVSACLDNAECTSVNDCMTPCQDDTCEQACYDAGTAAGKTLYDAAMTCVNEKCVKPAP